MCRFRRNIIVKYQTVTMALFNQQIQDAQRKREDGSNPEAATEAQGHEADDSEVIIDKRAVYRHAT